MRPACFGSRCSIRIQKVCSHSLYAVSLATAESSANWNKSYVLVIVLISLSVFKLSVSVSLSNRLAQPRSKWKSVKSLRASLFSSW